MIVEQAKEILPIMQAYAEGKTIQYFTDSGYWSDIRKSYNPSFDKDPSRYRVKPDPKIRPFHDAEECWKEMWKHHPFGWLRHDGMGSLLHIDYLNSGAISFNGDCIDTFDILFNKGYAFADGEPFGILEEEDEQ